MRRLVDIVVSLIMCFHGDNAIQFPLEFKIKETGAKLKIT